MEGADFLQLSPAAAPVRGLTGWLADAIRAAIIDGRLQAGAPLPATRLLAGDLGVSRGVIVEAYQRLADEGLVSARPGAGTRVLGVSALPPEPEPGSRRGQAAARPGQAAARPGQAAARPGQAGLRLAEQPDFALMPQRWRVRAEFDLSPGLPDLSGFPRAAWMRAERLVLEQASVADLGYGDPRGSQRLRTELAGWLARTRGLRTEPGDIIVVTGVAQALALLARVLRAHAVEEIAVEDPGSRGARDELAYWGLRPVPVPVDADGLQVGHLARGRARAVLLTPAHQFPTGVVLAPQRRRDLLDWAAGADAVVIEDDYDAEYRYDRAPVPALQASAPGLVAYAGSTSKTLAPGMRLGWLIPPARLHADLVEAKYASDLGSPALPQLVLARLIASGELEQHIRLVRKRQRSRRDALLRALRSHLPEGRVQGVAAGLHLLVTFPRLDGRDTDLAEAILRAGVLVHPLSWHRQRPGVPGLMLGYAVHTPDQLHEATRRIAQVAGQFSWRLPSWRLPPGLGLGAPDIGAAVPPGDRPQLADPRRPGKDDKQHAADGRQEQCHAERETAVRAHVGDADLRAVLQDEDQQEQQDDGEEAHGHPDAAGPGALDRVLRHRRGNRGRRRLTARGEFVRSRRRLGAYRLGRRGGGFGRGRRFRGHLAPPRISWTFTAQPWRGLCTLPARLKLIMRVRRGLIAPLVPLPSRQMHVSRGPGAAARRRTT